MSAPGDETASVVPWLRRIAGQLGPGLIWAMIAVGQTHVILATCSGARFGFSLLLLVRVLGLWS